MHFWIVCAYVYLSHAFRDCLCACGSLICICGLYVHVDLSCAFLYRPVDLLRAFVDCVCVSVDLSHAFVGGFDTVFTPYFL